MANFTDIYTGGIQAGSGITPPISTATFEPSIDPTRPFTIHSWGINQLESVTNQIGVHNEIGLYNGVGLWNQFGLGSLLGFGIDNGGHCDAQPVIESSASTMTFNSGNGSLNGFWTYNGVEITNEATDSTSDVNLKRDITPINDSLSKILKLNPVSFKWKEEQVPSYFVKRETEIGLIAQEVEEVIPEVIGEFSLNGDEYKKISYGKLTSVLIGAIQEQQEQINLLRETVQELSTRLAECLKA